MHRFSLRLEREFPHSTDPVKAARGPKGRQFIGEELWLEEDGRKGERGIQ